MRDNIFFLLTAPDRARWDALAPGIQNMLLRAENAIRVAPDAAGAITAIREAAEVFGRYVAHARFSADFATARLRAVTSTIRLPLDRRAVAAAVVEGLAAGHTPADSGAWHAWPRRGIRG